MTSTNPNDMADAIEELEGRVATLEETIDKLLAAAYNAGAEGKEFTLSESDGHREWMGPRPLCEDCGRPGKKTNCPYAEEVHGLHVEAVLCDECGRIRLRDV